MPKTPGGKHNEGAGRRGTGRSGPGAGKQTGWSIIGKIGWKLLGRKNKGGWDSPRER